MNEFVRSEILLGADGLKRLAASRVAVFGIGGVGGYAVEALARAGVGAIDIIDNDTVSESNINRQIIALKSTVGKYKVDVMKGRISDINPECRVTAYRTFFLPETRNMFDFSQFDYVLDAIDTVSGKIAVIECARESGVPVISCMGAGNKLDASRFEVAEIEKTSVCPLARVMRRELKARHITGVKVVYSKEMPAERFKVQVDDCAKRQTPGSVSYVPPVAGLLAAGEIIKYLSGIGNE